jgi:thiamine pyrophosphokinase
VRFLVCVLVAGGDFYGEIPNKYDFLIAVDGGKKYCDTLGLKPDLIVGDFDSLGYIPESDNIITLNKDKDESDTFFAVSYAVDKNFDEIHIFGATGGRFSHTFANIQTLNYCSEKNIKNFIYDKEEILTVISSKNTDKKLFFDENRRGYISVFSLNSESFVNVKGLKYELENATLTGTFPLGLSNEFIGKNAEIEVIDGTVLVVYAMNGGG